jgi:diguanylate cyclase (GGDEF)-like protein/PAS domain S-box-containing protein
MTPTAEPAGIALRERLDQARLAVLFASAKAADAATLLNAALLAAIVWGPFTAQVLTAWVGALLVVTLCRGLLHRQYAGDPGRRAPEHWERLFALGAFAAGALWAVPPAVLFAESDPLVQLAIVFVVGGSTVGAAGVYAASLAAFYAFATLPLLAVLLELVMQPGRTYQLLALTVLVFGVVMVRVYRTLHDNAFATLRNRIENEELLERLARNEAQLRDALESFPEGIAVFDAEDRLLVCNEVYARVYGGGRSARELAGASYRSIAGNAYEVEVVAPEYAGRRDAWLEARLAQRANSAGAVRQCELRDGRSLLGRFVRSRGGRIVSAFTDVTDLKRARDAYDRVRTEETLVLDTLPVGVAFLASRVIVRCNRRLEQMLGYQPGELDGKPARIIHPSEQAWRVAAERYALLRERPVLEEEWQLARKDGSHLWCQVLLRAVAATPAEESVIGAFSDVSARREAEQALRESEAMYRNLVETSSELIWSMDGAGRWTYLSPAAAQRIYGCPSAELVGRHFSEMLAPEVRERDVAVFRRVLAGEPVFDYETRHLRRDGSYVDLAFNAIARRDASGCLAGATGTAHDISREKAAAAALHESVERLRLAVEAADLHAWEWDAATDTLQFSRSPMPGLGGSTRMKASEYQALVHPEDRERYRAAWRASLERGEPYAVQFRLEGEDRQPRWISARGKLVAGAAGRARRMIGVSQDVTEAKRQEEEARFLAYHDTLTGLPNRRLLDDRLRQSLYLAQRRHARVALMMVDLDRFKRVNDSLGHRAGDAVLREAAHRIAACVRKADTLARHGGDEFVVVIPDLHLDADCQVVAEKVLRALEAPFRVDGHAFDIGASIGLSIYPADAADGESLLRNADVAMYRAKQLGGNNYRFYSR